MPKENAEKKKRVARKKIYKVEVDGEITLVHTTSRARAIKHVIGDRQIKVEIPAGIELVDYLKQGINVEEPEEKTNA